MNVQCAATSLIAWNDNLATVKRQHSNRRVVQPRKRKVGNATGKKSHAIPALADRRNHGSKAFGKERLLHARSEPRHARKFCAERPYAGASKCFKPRSLIHAKYLPGELQPLPVGKQVQEHLSQSCFKPWAVIVSINLTSRRFNQSAVLDARGTCGLAGAAIQAQVNVLHKTFAKRKTAALDLNHLVNSPARRIHFYAQFAVRRTTVQAQAAMNALRIIIPTRSFARTEAFRGRRFR